MHARTSDKIDAPAACDVICNEAVPFRPYCVGVATRTRNVSEYMLVLAVCLVYYHLTQQTSSAASLKQTGHVSNIHKNDFCKV